MKSLDALKEEIKLLARYAVPRNHMPQAMEFLDDYECDLIALNLLHNFYSYLPEGVDDFVRDIRFIVSKNGVYILCAASQYHAYLYLVTVEQCEFLGPLPEGVWDEEVLRFFGFPDRESFCRAFPDFDRLPPYLPLGERRDSCLICGALADGYHIFGCPAEICPWCGGQLVSCNCRFRELGKNELQSEHDAEAFLMAARKKGRIPFDPATQRVGFPVSAEDLSRR